VNSAKQSSTSRLNRSTWVLLPLLASWSISSLSCSESQGSPPLGSPMRTYTLRSGSIRAFSLSPNAELLLVRTASTNSGLGLSILSLGTGEVMQVQDSQGVVDTALQSLMPAEQPMRWGADSSIAYVPLEGTSSDHSREIEVYAAEPSSNRGAKQLSWLEVEIEPLPHIGRVLKSPLSDLATSKARDYLDPSFSIRVVGPFSLEISDKQSSVPLAHLAYFGVRKLAAKHLSGSPGGDLLGIVVGGERLFAWGPRASLIWRDGRHEPLELSGVVFPPLVWHPLLPQVFAVARNSKGTLEIRRWSYERAPP
jgi:hypothetical protein